MDRPFWRETMKVTKYALVIGAALGAVSANEQLGAVSKSDVEASGTKQGIYLNYSPFARFSANGGGGSSNGYIISAEKGITEGKNGPGVLGGFFSRVNGGNFYEINYRVYIQADSSLGLGILGGDGFNGKNDWNLYYMKDMPKTAGSPIDWQIGIGAYYDSGDKSINPDAGIKVSYPFQSGLSIDAAFWYFHRGGNSGNLITLGVGYRM